MAGLTQYLIYFEPPLSISERIYELHQRIARKYHNEYQSYIDGVWISHLMVYISPLPEENVPVILKEVQKIAQGLTKFEITLNGFIEAASNYIFVNIDSPINRLVEINNQLVHTIKPYRDARVKQKYLDMWDSFTPVQRARIKLTGHQYPYEPHITIVKVLPAEVERAIHLIKNDPLVGEVFLADKLHVLKFQDDVNTRVAEFPLI